MADFTRFVEDLNNQILGNTTITSTPSKVQEMPQASQSATVNDIVTPVKPKKPINFLIVTTHVNQINGYSKVVYNIIKELSKHDWIKVTHFATQNIKNASIGRTYPANVKVIDGTSLDKNKDSIGFGFSELPTVIKAEKPDVVFIYNDLSVICSYIEEIRKSVQSRTFRIWAYVDMVYKCQQRTYIDILNRDVEQVFCFTKTWKDELKESGITRPVHVLNHGVDTTLFRTIPKDLARQMLGLPKDVFLFTSLNRNQPRKRLDLLVMAFAELITKYPHKPMFLLVVGDTGDNGGYRLLDIFSNELKLRGASADVFGNRLLVTSKNTCYKDEDINVLYNVGDVGVACAEGEGFGLCTFEQMAVGVPQIVPLINGYSEYCTAENSLLVKPSLRQYLPGAYNPINGVSEVVSVSDVASAMEKYVFDEEMRKLHGKMAQKTVVEYTWSSCLKRLVTRLEVLRDEDDD